MPISSRSNASGALQEITLREAGAFGLNTEQALAVNDPRWLTEANNLVYDDSGRLVSRKGLNALTTTGAHSADTEAIFEYIQDATTTEIISAAGSKIYKGTTSLSDVTGTATPTADDWKFVNFNGKAIGVQQGHTPIVYSGTSFAPIVAASGSLPTGNAALAAWGRLWISDSDKTTLKISASLDETHWSTGAASLDTLEIWPDGIDEITALAEFQQHLLIFGTRSILVYRNPSIVIGTTPGTAEFELADIIRKGTKWRDSVVAVGQDLLFLSDDGMRSVSRGLASQSMPLSDLTSHIRTKLIAQELVASQVQAAYSPSDRAYLLRLVTVSGDLFWYFDLGNRLENGDLRAIEWDGIGWKSIGVASDQTVYLGMNGKVADHTGYQDNGASYSATWLSAGADLGEGLKILKKARVQVTCSTPTTFVIRWQTDLDRNDRTVSVTADCPSTASEWGIAEWSGGGGGDDEWTGLATGIIEVKAPLSHSGEIIQIGTRATVNGFRLAFSNMHVLFKVGRLAA